MPSLVINCCEDCPFSSISSEAWEYDTYTIKCNHEKQTNTEGFNHKMKFSNSIYFKCPLDSKEDSSEEDDS